jgi:hypothetical protein
MFVWSFRLEKNVEEKLQSCSTLRCRRMLEDPKFVLIDVTVQYAPAQVLVRHVDR